MVVECWNRQHHGQTIHPTEKFTSMNLYKIIEVVTWAWLLLTSMEAAKGQLILKWFFGVVDFLQKTNENKST